MSFNQRLRDKLAAALVSTTAVLLFGCQSLQHPGPETDPLLQTGADPFNALYLIDHQPVRLVDGEAIGQAAPGSSSRTVTRIWGEPRAVDLNLDGLDDAVLILTQTTGGTGTFYFVAAAIAGQEGYAGTAGLYLGDRIVPENLAIMDSRVRISYRVRREGEPFTAEPTVPRRKDLLYDQRKGGLIEVAVDFEGEADPNRMTLQMHTWRWVRTLFNNDTVIEPAEPGAFTLTFGDDGQVSGTTDCNGFRGKVTIEKQKIRFDENMAMTRMFCTDSQEGEFMRMLQSVRSFFFTSRGELIMELQYDSGSVFFR